MRGVNSEGVIASLIDKGLVREAGRDKDRGHAVLYGTTTAFLERFGLSSIKALPPLEDFAPDEASRRFIIERLGGRAAPAPADDGAGQVGAERDEEVVTGQVEVTGDVLDDIDPGLLEVDDDDDE